MVSLEEYIHRKLEKPEETEIYGVGPAVDGENEWFENMLETYPGQATAYYIVEPGHLSTTAEYSKDVIEGDVFDTETLPETEASVLVVAPKPGTLNPPPPEQKFAKYVGLTANVRQVEVDAVLMREVGQDIRGFTEFDWTHTAKQLSEGYQNKPEALEETKPRSLAGILTRQEETNGLEIEHLTREGEEEEMILVF